MDDVYQERGSGMITVKLFGLLRLDSGIKIMKLEAESLRALHPLVLKEITKARPDTEITEAVIKDCIVVVNGKRVRPNTKLRDGDEVVYLSPGAGG